jgi:hypothetical protein
MHSGAFLALGSVLPGDTGNDKYGSKCWTVPGNGCYAAIDKYGRNKFLFTCLSIGIILSVAGNAEVVEDKTGSRK